MEQFDSEPMGGAITRIHILYDVAISLGIAGTVAAFVIFVLKG